MKINIELTAEILEVLSPEQQKQILLDIITPKPTLKEFLLGGRDEKELQIIRKTITPKMLWFPEPPAASYFGNPTGWTANTHTITELLEQPVILTKTRTKVVKTQAVLNRHLKVKVMQLIKAEYQQGQTINELSEKYGISYKTLWRRLKEAGQLKKKSRQ